MESDLMEIPDMTPEELAEYHHDEIKALFDKLISAVGKKDPSVIEALNKNAQVLDLLVKKIAILQPKDAEVKIEYNNSQIISSLNDIGSRLQEGLSAMADKLSAIESKPVVEPKKKEFEFSIVRDANNNMQKIIAKEK